jgi:hypothetical protein
MIVIRLARFAHGIEICSQQSENLYKIMSLHQWRFGVKLLQVLQRQRWRTTARSFFLGFQSLVGFLVYGVVS